MEYGGAQRQVVELANHINPDVFKIHVCSLSDYVPLSSELKLGDERLHIARKQHKFDLTVAFKLAHLFRKLKADLVHTFLFDADFFGRLGAMLARVPVIIGSERNCFEEPRFRNLAAWRLTQPLVDLTIANSNAGADFNQRMLHQPRSSYRVVHNGVNVNRFTPKDGKDLRGELNIKADEKIVGIFGSFKPQKNHETFFRVAKMVLQQLPQTRFLVVGDELYLGMSNSVEWKQKIQNLVDELGLRERCLFLGNRKDVERLYNICDVTVLPSLFEGTPNVALESMACGVPVIASDVSDNKYVIPDGKAGFVVAVNDVDSMAQRVVSLLSNDAERIRFGQNAREWVLKEFSCERLAEKTVAVYQEALSRK
ncbi:MAG: glycosyltransferase [Verrucomicrobiota bacterium]